MVSILSYLCYIVLVVNKNHSLQNHNLTKQLTKWCIVANDTPYCLIITNLIFWIADFAIVKVFCRNDLAARTANWF